MCPKLKVENVEVLEPLVLDKYHSFDNVVNYFHLFVNVMNMHITNNDHHYLTPYMRMLAQVANFITNNAENKYVDLEYCEQYIEGMKWALNEFAPDGMIFDINKYLEIK